MYMKENGVAKRFEPLKKDGTPYKNIPKKVSEEVGAVIGITSQISNHLDKGWLIPWNSTLAIDSAFEALYEYAAGVVGVSQAQSFRTIPKATKDYAKAILKEKSNADSNRGTEYHNGIDSFLKTGVASEDPLIAVAQTQVADFLKAYGIDPSSVKAEHCVLFNGGITLEDGTVLEINNGATADLISKSLLVDWKTTKKASDGKYHTGKIDHCAQLAFCKHAACQDGHCDHDAKCVNVYISRLSGKIVAIKEWKQEELDVALEWVGRCYECDKAKAKLEGVIK